MAHFGAKIQRLALALASGLSAKDAAREAGLSRRSATRALRQPLFVRKVRRIQADMRERVVGRLTDACTEAVQTLRAMLAEGTPATARLGAARAILEHAGRMAETVQLEARIAELEAAKEAKRAPEYAETD